MREGLQNIAPSSVIGEENRLFQFHKGGNESDMLVEISAGDGLIHFYVDGVEQGDTVAHSYTLSQLPDLYFTNQEVTGVICHADHPPLYIEIALDGSISGALIPSANVPLVDYRDAASPSVAATTTNEYDLVFNPGDDGNLWADRDWIMRYDGVWVTGNQGNIKSFRFKDATKNIERLTEALNRLLSLKNTTILVTSSAIDAYKITLTGENAGKVLEIKPENPIAERYVDIESDIDESDTDEPAWSYPTYVTYDDGGGVDYYQCIQPNSPETGVNDPTFPAYWTNIGATKPDTFDWQYPDGNVWQAFDAGPPAVFTESYGPGGRGFPKVCVVQEQRLILMANPGFTMGMFGSRINQYKDFILGPEDDDPFFKSVDTSDTPTIKWAVASGGLVLGTSSGDHSVSAQVTLSPSDTFAKRDNSARSHDAKAVMVNTDIFYIEQGREKIRSTRFNDTVEKQTSNDVSLIAEHLLNSRAKRIVLMQTPEVVIFILRDDGSLACISYSHEQQNAAWYEFEMQGVITDIAVCYTVGAEPGAYDPSDPLNTMNTDEDELWATVTYDGGVTHYIEKMPYPKRTFTAATEDGDPFLVDQHLVMIDGWIRNTILIADNNVISGLEQFEGLTVAVVVEDAWAGEYTVQDGKVILADADIDETFSGTYAVGLRYTGTLRTFEMSSGSPQGTGLGTQRRWNQLFVKILDSSLPIINNIRPPDRKPETLMGMAEIIQVGLQERDMVDLGWDDKGIITIVQDRPYPTHILGCFGQFNSHNG